MRLATAPGWLVWAGPALAEPTFPPPRVVVAPTEQAVRDSDRVEILREELKKSEALLGALAQRKGDRLAASDQVGAAEAEEQHTRTLADVAGLRRELASVTRTSPSSPATARVSSSTELKPTAARSPAPKAPALAPWWDVYGKTRRPEPAPLEPRVLRSETSSEAVPRAVSAR